MTPSKGSMGSVGFKPLPISTGVGPYHVNQCRIYFKPPLPTKLSSSGREEAIQKIADDFLSEFPCYFNGHTSPMLKNLASVDWGGSSRRFLEKKTLRFVLDAKIKQKVLGKEVVVDLPDLHSDWVYIVWDNLTKAGTKGFAAQTVRREFAEPEDITVFNKTLSSIQPALIILLGPVEGIRVAIRVALEVVSLNQNHVLAGRRSWIAGWANDYPGALQLPSHKSVFFIETATVERYSTSFVEPMETMVGAREDVIRIWSNLLNNYALYNKSRFLFENKSPFFFQKSDGPGWQNIKDTPCHYRQQNYDSESLLKKDDWVLNLLKAHPALDMQLASAGKGFKTSSLQPWGK